MEPDSISDQDEQRNMSGGPGRKRFTRNKLCLLLIPIFVILTMLLFFIVNIYHTPGLNELLGRARLAQFPESIQNLQFEIRPVLDNDQGEPKHCYLFVRFQARSNDINNFIKSSPGIEKNHFLPLRPMPDNHEAPTWWPTDDSSGRMYIFERYEREYITGIVAVYDDSNTVRIWAQYMVNPQLRNMLEDIEDMRDAFDDFIYDLWHEVTDLFD